MGGGRCLSAHIENIRHCLCAGSSFPLEIWEVIIPHLRVKVGRNRGVRTVSGEGSLCGVNRMYLYKLRDELEEEGIQVVCFTNNL